MAIFSWFIRLLIIIPIFARNLHLESINNFGDVVESTVEEILPQGMSVSAYNKLVLSYWTPERMASAKPRNVFMLENITALNTRNSPLPSMDNTKHTPRRVSLPGKSPKSLNAARSVVGKIYGRMGSSNYVCSGSVIISENGDTVLTAGHCVWDTDSQIWATDIVFVPAYFKGSSPYGRWVWRSVAAMRGWTVNRDFNYDVAVVLLATSDEEQHLQDLTGSLGITVNEEREAYTDSYGYPVNIHRGEEMASCSDQASPANIPQFPTYEGMRLPCNMTGGSSGGPWTQKENYQTSVNSFGLVGEKDVMYGPYFGDAVWNLWERYQTQ